MQIKAPAKINLFLNVGPRKEKFHSVNTIMVKVSLYDEIELSEEENIHLKGPDWIPTEENLAYKAALLLREESSCKKGCRIKLKKKIPAGRGLGGGSSDAASVLMGLNEMWKLKFPTEKLKKIGAKLGSDVNFFLQKGPALATGRGEKIRPVKFPEENRYHILLIDPGINISTKNIYDNHDPGSLTLRQELDRIIKYFQIGNWEEILKNDLEKTVFREYPVLNDLKNRVVNWGGKPLLSGSGSALFALFNKKDLAESVSGIINKRFKYKTWIVKPVNGV